MTTRPITKWTVYVSLGSRARVILLPSLEIPKRVFTPAAITIIRELAAEGKTAAEIAEVVDFDAGKRSREMLPTQDLVISASKR